MMIKLRRTSLLFPYCFSIDWLGKRKILLVYIMNIRKLLSKVPLSGYFKNFVNTKFLKLNGYISGMS